MDYYERCKQANNRIDELIRILETPTIQGISLAIGNEYGFSNAFILKHLKHLKDDNQITFNEMTGIITKF